MFVGLSRTSGTASCSGGACESMWAWDDGSPLVYDDIANMSTLSIGGTPYVQGDINPTSFAFAGSYITGVRLASCTAPCDPPPPTSCYEIASLRSEAPRLSLPNTQDICQSYGQTLPVLKSLQHILDYLEWHYNDTDLTDLDSDYVYLGLQRLDASNPQDCTDAECDTELLWVDGSPFVYDDIKLVITRVLIYASSTRYLLLMSVNNEGGDLLLGNSGTGTKAGVCTAPCQKPARLACYNPYNSYPAAPSPQRLENQDFICGTLGFTRPVLKSNRAFKEFAAWYLDEAKMTREYLWD